MIRKKQNFILIHFFFPILIVVEHAPMDKLILAISYKLLESYSECIRLELLSYWYELFELLKEIYFHFLWCFAHLYFTCFILQECEHYLSCIFYPCRCWTSVENLLPHDFIKACFMKNSIYLIVDFKVPFQYSRMFLYLIHVFLDSLLIFNHIF